MVLMLLASYSSVKCLGNLAIKLIVRVEEQVAICCNRDTTSFLLLGRPASFGFALKIVW